MICKQCNKQQHVCSSCGVEEYLYDYCSVSCLKESGHSLCPTCNGWGWACWEEEEDDYEGASCPGYVKTKENNE